MSEICQECMNRNKKSHALVTLSKYISQYGKSFSSYRNIYLFIEYYFHASFLKEMTYPNFFKKYYFYSIIN